MRKAAVRRSVQQAQGVGTRLNLFSHASVLRSLTNEKQYYCDNFSYRNSFMEALNSHP
ncbi:hypothetical protein RSPO_m01222 (plasmid) [Ralstonia solanacearum Po82]|uniref:Uncharacterized protein n=1 Tax=Ralstonia solanacearum (strain Po82) TaxID=1031711 RepID=F6GBC8_RALS8|nr:hypothetical protein RSPO_m01222 [Ralstonia solanacearum Po82]